MKKLNLNYSVLAFALCLMPRLSVLAATDLPARAPTLDTQGRFWIYRNGSLHPKMPFTPYGWMSDATNLSQLIQIDLECRDHPNTVWKVVGVPERDSCIRMKVNWGEASWAGVAFISGPDKPAWWGDNNRGRYYNLSSLPNKKIVFYARGEKGGECIKAQIGVLGKKPFGDSLHDPIVSDELTLTPNWVRYEVDLKDIPPNDLARICNGFGVVAERGSQSGSGTETQFYIDDIYME